MNRVFRLFTICLTVALLTTLALFTGCEQPAANNNAARGNSNAAPTTTPSTPGTSGTPAAKTGTITVDSKPAGASVLLLATDEGEASPPEPRGTTPTTIDGLEPGKYTVHLEMRGYKAFQKEVEVKAGATVPVVGQLKK